MFSFSYSTLNLLPKCLFTKYLFLYCAFFPLLISHLTQQGITSTSLVPESYYISNKYVLKYVFHVIAERILCILGWSEKIS